MLYNDEIRLKETQRTKPLQNIMFDLHAALKKASDEVDQVNEEFAEAVRLNCQKTAQIRTECEQRQKAEKDLEYYKQLAEERYKTIMTEGCSATVGYHLRESEKTVEEQKNKIEDLVRCNENQQQSLIQLKTENLKLNAELLEEKKEHAYYKDLADTRRIRMTFFDKENEKLKEQINSLIKELNSKEVIISEQKELIKDLKERSAVPFTNASIIGYANHYKATGEWGYIHPTHESAYQVGFGGIADKVAVPVYTIP